jgi:DUF4097 and DUF4098 domain-containing protein YvlB
MKRMSLKGEYFVALMLFGFVFSWATLPAKADEWSKTYTLTDEPDLRVDTSDANIRVSTWDQNTIEANVTTTRYKIGGDGIRIDERQADDMVEIDVRYPHMHGFDITINGGNHRVDIDIHMPREGRVDLHTGDGKLRATTGDGHIRANGRFDELELKTGDGRVDARAAAGSALAAGWRLESGDGTVSLEVPDNLAADVDLHTGDGHIDLDMPVTTEGKIRENEIRGKLNGGGNLLVIHTGDGSIRLRKG